MDAAKSSGRAQRWPVPMGTILAAMLLAACQQPSRDIFQQGMTAYNQGDFKTALEKWRRLAESGDPSAQTNVGLLYSQGKGVTQDPAEAFKWYRMAAMQNHIDAQYNLAVLYRDGKGVEPNMEEAIRWFQRAAEKGHLRAQLRLGDIYYKGEGVAANAREAIKWYEAAADHGEPEAQLALGDIYWKGDGVPIERVRAYFWYSAAAMQDYDPLIRARASMSRMRLLGELDEFEVIEGERQAVEWREIKRTEANR